MSSPLLPNHAMQAEWGAARAGVVLRSCQLLGLLLQAGCEPVSGLLAQWGLQGRSLLARLVGPPAWAVDALRSVLWGYRAAWSAMRTKGQHVPAWPTLLPCGRLPSPMHGVDRYLPAGRHRPTAGAGGCCR